jgi:hypothetical protein
MYRPITSRTTRVKTTQWFATGRWVSPRTPVSSTNKTDCHDRTDILLKVVLNTIDKTTTATTNHVNDNFVKQQNSMQFIVILQILANLHKFF